MSEHSDEWIVEELILELDEAKAMGREPTFFVSGKEEAERIKRLLPVAEKEFKKDANDERDR